MKVIITGASGFVGQNLKQYLSDRKCEINSLSLRSKNWNKVQLTSADAIIHLAGKAHDTADTSDDDEYFKVNRDLTIELFDMFLKSELRDFFYFSSVKAVADTVETVLEEDILGRPQTPYGKSKWEAEQYLLAQPLPKTKRLFIIRPCMIHGPGNKGNLNLLYSFVERGIPWPLGSFRNQRSFLSIDNLSFLVDRMLVDHTVPSGVYNFSDDEVLSTNELVILISKLLKKKPKMWHIYAKLIQNFAKIGDVLPFPLNTERLKKLTESYVVSNAKIKYTLGIEKLPLTAKDGLEKTIRSFQR